MLLGLLAAGVTSVLIASPIASWVVAQQTFESPDEVGAMHRWVFLGISVGGLLVGWTLGFMFGARIDRERRRFD
ncbi:MAG: hypothetical protein AAFR04_01960 [Pseudomonadota bacterium]